MRYFIGLLLAFVLVSSQQAQAATPEYFNAVVDAIYRAEGGARAKKPFGILSVPCSDYRDCRKVCYNTVRNNWKRWERSGGQGEFLEFLARRYAPLNVKNDPQGLNKNWLGNVRAIMKG